MSKYPRKSLEIIVPIYNEENCFNELFRQLMILRKKMNYVNTSFIFVNDGSRDNSLTLLLSKSKKHSFVKIIDFSRNFGHQMALTAAFDNSNADYVAVIDADLQDPPELIEAMYKRAILGFDIVYGIRKKRDNESLFKLATAKAYYYILSKMVNVDIPRDTGDFRLISRRVVDQMKIMREHHRYIRGMIPWSGFKSTPIYYHRKTRFSGETKYSISKMLKLAKDGIFSFSNIPLRFTTYLGMIVFFLGFFGGTFLLYLYMRGINVPGITATLLTIIIMSGIQIIMIGVTGEYIGRIFEEVKNRPLYIIRQKVNFEGKNRNKS